jgi:hypothetical protein
VVKEATTTASEETDSFLVRLPRDQNRKLSQRALDEGRPKAEIVRDALTLYLK